MSSTSTPDPQATQGSTDVGSAPQPNESHPERETRSALDELVRTLRLDAVGPVAPGVERFVGQPSQPMGLARTYGGHIVGQAVAAAQATVANDRQLHSLHAYFLRGGRHGEPFHYDVEVVRDGRSYTARRVRAWQDEGRSSFELLASFAVAEDGPTAALQTPPEALQVPPETLPTYRELVDQMAGSEQMPSPDGWTTRVSPIDIRPTNASWHPDGTGPNNSVNQWIRADGVLPNDPALHIAVLAYQSDESLADTVFAPFGLNWGDADNAVASLDHALWIHRPIDCNRWIYVEQFPEAVHGGRGLGRARMWNQDGQLVASATQDVLLRIG